MNSEFTREWFDSCSRAWHANKKRCGYTYKYVCGVEECQRNCVKGLANCRLHDGKGVVLSVPVAALPTKRVTRSSAAAAAAAATATATARRQVYRPPPI